MNKDKVMIVGAGAGQVPIIKCCKSHGLFTIVVSPFGPYPGIALADKHVDENIFNKDSLVEIGKKEGISYVISDQSDYAVPIVAYVAERLNLPGNRLKTAETYTYKSEFRIFCHKNGIPSPKSIEFDKSDNLDIQTHDLKIPVIVKPSDSQGSRGVEKVNDFEMMGNAIDNAFLFSRNGKIIIEEYFEGREIVCEGFVINGEYFNVAFGDREYFSIPDLFIPSKTIFPSSLSDGFKEKIIANERKVSALLKPSFGIVHSEYLINEDGEFIVIESALRGGGVYIASHLVPLTTGIDLTEVLFNSMIGHKETTKRLLTPKKMGAAEYVCFYLNEGIVDSVEGPSEIKGLQNVRIAELDNIHVGDIIGKFEHKGMRKGPFIIAGTNLEAVNKTEMEIKKRLSISVNGSDGIVWD